MQRQVATLKVASNPTRVESSSGKRRAERQANGLSHVAKGGGRLTLTIISPHYHHYHSNHRPHCAGLAHVEAQIGPAHL